MALFNKLPKTITLGIMLIKALDLKDGLRLIQEILYLYREFYIRTRIDPKIREYTVSFSYKDNQLIQFSTTDLKELLRVAQQIKESRID